jgi:uncharacterized protein
MPQYSVNHASFLRGIELFNHGEFFEAHEVLEDVWRVAPQVEKKFLQGLIQVAVSFHHRSARNIVGARSLLERGCSNLSCYPGSYAGIDLDNLRESLARWHEALSEGSPAPPMPRVEFK